jgi:hypothetical protein
MSHKHVPANGPNVLNNPYKKSGTFGNYGHQLTAENCGMNFGGSHSGSGGSKRSIASKQFIGSKRSIRSGKKSGTVIEKGESFGSKKSIRTQVSFRSGRSRRSRRSGVSGDSSGPLTSERTETKIKRIEGFIDDQGRATGGYVKNLNQLLKRRDKLSEVKTKLDKTHSHHLHAQATKESGSQGPTPIPRQNTEHRTPAFPGITIGSPTSSKNSKQAADSGQSPLANAYENFDQTNRRKDSNEIREILQAKNDEGPKTKNWVPIDNIVSDYGKESLKHCGGQGMLSRLESFHLETTSPMLTSRTPPPLGHLSRQSTFHRQSTIPSNGSPLKWPSSNEIEPQLTEPQNHNPLIMRRTLSLNDNPQIAPRGARASLAGLDFQSGSRVNVWGVPKKTTVEGILEESKSNEDLGGSIFKASGLSNSIVRNSKLLSNVVINEYLSKSKYKVSEFDFSKGLAVSSDVNGTGDDDQIFKTRCESSPRRIRQPPNSPDPKRFLFGSNFNQECGSRESLQSIMFKTLIKAPGNSSRDILYEERLDSKGRLHKIDTLRDRTNGSPVNYDLDVTILKFINQYMDAGDKMSYLGKYKSDVLAFFVKGAEYEKNKLLKIVYGIEDFIGLGKKLTGQSDGTTIPPKATPRKNFSSSAYVPALNPFQFSGSVNENPKTERVGKNTYGDILYNGPRTAKTKAPPISKTNLFSINLGTNFDNANHYLFSNKFVDSR